MTGMTSMTTTMFAELDGGTRLFISSRGITLLLVAAAAVRRCHNHKKLWMAAEGGD